VIVEPDPGEPTVEQSATARYFCFRVGEKSFGIGVEVVQEIVRMLPVTRVPYTPEFVLGVMNLRGKVIPVADLRVRLGVSDRSFCDRTCIVVVNLPLRRRSETCLLGLVVDEVEDVIVLPIDGIARPEKVGAHLEKAVTGVVRHEGRIKTLLDLPPLVAIDQLTRVMSAKAS